MAGFYEQRDRDGNLIGWQCKVRKKGFPTQTKVFRTKKEAQNWAAVIESEMARGVWQNQAVVKQVTLRDLLERYAQEITPFKKGAEQEQYRINVLMRASMAELPVGKVSGKEIALWRDARLKRVSGSTVNRDLNVLGNAFEIARKEWDIPVHNPCRDIRRPKHNPERTRRISDEEVHWLLQCMEKGKAAQVKPIFLLSLATSMRRGETMHLRWEHVDAEARTVWLPDTKTDTSRYVPLSRQAVQILDDLREQSQGRNVGPIFHLSGPCVNDTWRATVKRARILYEKDCAESGIEPDPAMLVDLHFHDTRHEATSRAFEKGLNIMEVSTMTGHKDLRSLKRYTQLRAEDIARKLD